MNTKQEIIATYGQLAMIYGKQLSPQALVLMVDSLDDLAPGDVLRVLREWVKRNKSFPMPSDLREAITPVVSDLDDGRDIASRVIKSIARYGWNNPEAAKNYIGEIGWECVSRMGGWVTLCQELSDENRGILVAHIRDLAVTLKKKSIAGTINDPLNFPNQLPDGSSRDSKKIPDSIKNMLPSFQLQEID